MENTTINIAEKHRIKKRIKLTILTIVIFAIAIIYFSPILYMFMTSFKTEHQAVRPSLIFKPTLETIKMVLSDRNMFGYLKKLLLSGILYHPVLPASGCPGIFCSGFWQI